MEGKICSSCKKKIVNDPGNAQFKCPACSQYEIVRCSSCRTNSVKYACPGCSFLGPN